MTEEMNRTIKRMAEKIYRDKGIKPSCERCFYLSDPECPDFLHICVLEEGLKNPEERDWIVENLPHCIEMRKRYEDNMRKENK